MPDKIPILDLPQLHASLREELIAAFARAVETAGFIGGKALAEFEAAFAAYCGSPNCVGVANGTDALTLALKALGVGPGDDVLVPAYTFIATAEAVLLAGATPRFVDIDPLTYNIDVDAARAASADNVKAVIPVHLYGQPADMGPLMELAQDRGWHVLEDCAQAHGARYRERRVGTFGELAGFSFYPGKNLGALGDGGAVIGKDSDVLQKLRQLSDHGRVSRNEHVAGGVNSRLDAIQAAALAIKLPHLDAWNEQRKTIATSYSERLESVRGVGIPRTGPERDHVYHLYVVQVADRDGLCSALAKQNIQSAVHYPVPLHRQPAFADGDNAGQFPVAEGVAQRCLSLPIFPGMTEAQVERVVAAVVDYVSAGS